MLLFDMLLCYFVRYIGFA